MAQCSGWSERTGERCRRSATAGAATCYYHSPSARQASSTVDRTHAAATGQGRDRGHMTGDTFTTKELSNRTWPDYVRFFSQGNGWDHCGCTAYQGFRPPSDVRAWADKRDWNLDVKCKLVGTGRAHGVLVYDRTEPIGWCQFGPDNELPIRDGGARRRSLFDDGEERRWRITCFCTHPDYARSGVAAVALRAALDAIARRGGGMVEAWPVAHVNLDDTAERERRRLTRWYNKFARLQRERPVDRSALERHIADAPDSVEVTAAGEDYEVRGVTLLALRGGGTLHIDGVGEVNATAFGRFHGGTVAMFQREGFDAVSVLPVSPRVREVSAQPARVVMQKTVPSYKRS